MLIPEVFQCNPTMGSTEGRIYKNVTSNLYLGEIIVIWKTLGSNVTNQSINEKGYDWEVSTTLSDFREKKKY